MVMYVIRYNLTIGIVPFVIALRSSSYWSISTVHYKPFGAVSSGRVCLNWVSFGVWKPPYIQCLFARHLVFVAMIVPGSLPRNVWCTDVLISTMNICIYIYTKDWSCKISLYVPRIPHRWQQVRVSWSPGGEECRKGANKGWIRNRKMFKSSVGRICLSMCIYACV